MQAVERYKFRLGDATTASTLNIPIDMTFQLVDQAEVIERKFVAAEVEKATNPIIDYEKVRFTPSYIGGTILQAINSVVYNFKFWDTPNNDYFNAPMYSTTTYAQIGFVDGDLKFRKSNFKNSFVRLDFYDSDVVTDQRLISYIIIQPDIRLSDIQSNSQLYPVSNKPVSFRMGNPLANNEVFGEGYFIYHFKDEVESNIPKELFMRASFNNAKNGKTTNLMTAPYDTNIPIHIDELVTQLHTKYVLVRHNTGYFYSIDDTYSTNVISNPSSYTVNLYEVRVA
tara:strand:+ start:1011 stop:1859 length:849 start_codon:yes stop_codon:yes gene_type:complete